MTSRAAHYFRLMVQPTVVEFFAEPNDIRRACLAAIVLWQATEYIKADRGSSARHDIMRRCPDFSIIHDVADATKHAELRISTPPRQISSAQQVSRSPGLFDAPFDESGFGEATVVFATLDDGTEVELKPVIRAGFDALRSILKVERDQ